MLDLGRNKNVGKGSVQTLKGVMCEFGAGGVACGSYHIGQRWSWDIILMSCILRKHMRVLNWDNSKHSWEDKGYN
jgi:hypothetical protein